jgi:hypothetical protein
METHKVNILCIIKLLFMYVLFTFLFDGHKFSMKHFVC